MMLVLVQIYFITPTVHLSSDSTSDFQLQQRIKKEEKEKRRKQRKRTAPTTCLQRLLSYAPVRK
jgi:hypothetical protein